MSTRTTAILAVDFRGFSTIILRTRRDSTSIGPVLAPFNTLSNSSFRVTDRIVKQHPFKQCYIQNTVEVEPVSVFVKASLRPAFIYECWLILEKPDCSSL
jgi:hypothetical protein